MSCKFDKNIIQKYIDNTIEPLELIVLKEHIAVCQDCKFELELMSKLEDSMYQYFENLPDGDMLDAFSMKMLQECYKGTPYQNFKNGMVKAWDINKAMVSNASRYAGYLPGSKLAASVTKKAGKRLNTAVKNYAKNSLKKLVANAIK